MYSLFIFIKMFLGLWAYMNTCLHCIHATNLETLYGFVGKKVPVYGTESHEYSICFKA